MHTISFASCLLRKARKNSSAYSQNFLHATPKDKASQDLSEMSFFFHQINRAGTQQVFLSILKCGFLRLPLLQCPLHLLQTGGMKVPGSPQHVELYTRGASCIFKVYESVSLAQAGEARTAFSTSAPAEV